MQSIVKINDVAIQTDKELDEVDTIAFNIFARIISNYLKQTDDNKEKLMHGIEDVYLSLIADAIHIEKHSFYSLEDVLAYLKKLSEDKE